jgi:NAD(P)-dependent dehydrogenase (short-subunit alcohol dehydrogenase family)
MSGYDKWIKKNTHLLTNQLAIVIGATGSIGKEIVDYLLMLKAKVIIGARNLDKAEALKNQLLLKYPDAKIYIEHIDISSLESIDNFQLEVDRKYQKADIFINNSGVYHLQKSLSKDGYEMHFATNTLGNYYLAKKIIYDLKENAKMIFVSSLAANFYKINFSDFQSLHTKSRMKVYATSKRIMMANTISLKKALENSSIDVNITHPGICATELFTKSHSKLFNIFIYPLMKLVFHSPKKAALNIIKAIFVETKENEWVAPRGLFGAWGYPKVLRFKKSIYDESVIEQVSDITADMISRHCEKK